MNLGIHNKWNPLLHWQSETKNPPVKFAVPMNLGIHNYIVSITELAV